MKAKARYEIKDVIARGGMGVVYRAQDKMMNRLVALKTIYDLSDPRAIKMFQREWQDLASLTHPNIVEVFDVGELEIDGESRPYLVMPLLPGATLDELIKTGSQRLTVERSVDIITQTSRGLQAAHDRGIVHRDLKPSNIFVMPDDSVKIIDFGVAGRLDKTKTLGRKGTILYMSPEQLENKPVTAVSDIFSLAVVCYETLARKRPFERATEEEVVECILRWTPPPVSEINPAVSTMISKVIQKGMAKQPWHRFATAREFAETLQKALRNEPIESLNPAKIQARLQRAQDAYTRGDLALASEILGELEAEGHFDSEIGALKGHVTRGQTDREIGQLLESARVREQHQEYPLALQKIHEILQLNPHHTEALALKSRIDNSRTEADIEEWLRVSHQHLDNFSYSHAREALQRVLQLRPREPRALQMLAEADRREQDYIHLRQEKETLYRAAVAHAQNGEISQALSKAGRVLELDKQAPELMDASRTTSYHSFYNRVRSESESLKAAYQEARTHLSNRNHAAARAICDEQLLKHPKNDAFLALRLEVEEQRRKALSARIAELDREVDDEPDLARRVSLLAEANREFPGEPHFQHALQLAEHKLGLVESIVSKARAFEERSQFAEAITQWETLDTIHHTYPGITLELERLRKRRAQQERQDRKRRWVEQIERNLERNEFKEANEALKNATDDFPEDAELTELVKRAERGLARWEESNKLFESGREAYQEQRWEEATALLRRAMELDDRNPAVRSTLIETLVRRAQNAHEKEPAAAETLLKEALEIEPNHALAKGLLGLIADQRRTEWIEGCLSHARQLQNENDLRGALKEVSEALNQFPDDSRLTQLHANLTRDWQDERRQHLSEARRIERDSEGVSDERAAQEYARRLETIVTRYQDDDEFQNLAAGARKRLQTKSSPTQSTGAGTPPPAPPAKKLPASGKPLSRPPAWVIGGGVAAILVVGAILPFALHKKTPRPVQIATPVPQPTPIPAPAAPQTEPLTVLGSGKIDIDGGPQEDMESVYNKEFPIGGDEHKIDAYTGQTGVLSFSFTAAPGQPAAVKIEKGHDILAFLVSTSDGKGTIYSSRRLGDLKIDGTSVGTIGPDGVALPENLSGSDHKLEWMEGTEAKSRDIHFDVTRGLLVQLDADPNLGSLVVKLNVPVPVDITVRSSTGREIRRATGVSGQWGPSQLRAGNYTIEASPRQGYEKTTMQASIKKNAEQTLAMDFKKLITPAHMLVATAPHAHIFLNGAAQGDADDSGKFAFQSLAPGHYQVIARLNGYRDGEADRDLGDGANETLPLPLTRAAGTVVLQRDPANAVVFWSRAGEAKWEPFEGGSKVFPEGEYVFRAQADGYNEVTAGPVSVQGGRSVTVPVHLTARVKTSEVKAAPVNVCANWPGGTPDKNSCLIKSSMAYAQAFNSGQIEFKAWSQDDRGLRWQVGYRDDKNYWEFELSGKSLKVWEVARKRSEKLNTPVRLDMSLWHEMLMTVKANSLRLQIPDAQVDQTLGDAQSDFSGKFRVEVRKSNLPVWVMLAHRQ
ncbi:MAG TPA: protein kinase [Bryobacteraceae bacterium]|nr:protein kinase [Bryobacteraceae bacterium]